MRVHVCRGNVPEPAWTYFSERAISAFLRPQVLNVFFGGAWHAVLVDDGRNAMLNTFLATPIGRSGYYDVEPWLGYAGAHFTTRDCAFVAEAFAAYRDTCRSMAVIAELMRFDPLRANHDLIAGLPGVTCLQSRLIAYVPVVAEEGAQERIYSAPCRRQIHAAERNALGVKRMEEAASWACFQRLYESSLRRVGAARRWFFDDAAFGRMMRSPAISLWGTFENDQPDAELLSGTVVLTHGEEAYSLLVANGRTPAHKGAHDLATHRIIRAAAAQGCRWLCLGGGRSALSDDSLLRFKAKFSGGHLRPLPLALVTHDAAALQRLYSEVDGTSSLPLSIQPSGEAIADFMRYRFSEPFANHDALA